MDEVVPECDLVLVIGLIEIFVKHLNKGLFGIQLSLIVLRVDIDFISEFFCLCDSHNFSPVSEQLFLVKVHYLVLVLDFRSKDIFFHLC